MSTVITFVCIAAVALGIAAGDLITQSIVEKLKIGIALPLIMLIILSQGYGIYILNS